MTRARARCTRTVLCREATVSLSCSGNDDLIIGAGPRVLRLLIRCQGGDGAVDRKQVGKSHMQEWLGGFRKYSRQPVKVTVTREDQRGLSREQWRFRVGEMSMRTRGARQEEESESREGRKRIIMTGCWS